MVKITISINEDLLSALDQYADENYMTRSGLISMCCNQYLVAQQTQAAVVDMAAAMRKIADAASDGVVSDEVMKELEGFEQLAAMLSKAVKA